MSPLRRVCLLLVAAHISGLLSRSFLLSSGRSVCDPDSVVDPGRNSSCPCGSGLKYKRCCAHGFTEEDADRGFEALELLAESAGSSDLLWDIFYGPQGRCSGPARPEDTIFRDWLFFDVRDGRGVLIVDLLLRAEGLPLGIRAFAAAMRDSAFRLYETMDHRRRGSQVVLRDVLSGVTHVLANGFVDGVGLYATRIVTRGGQGRSELHGACLAFPLFMRSELIGSLRDELAEFRRAGGSGSDEWKALAPILFQRWCSFALPMPPAAEPLLVTGDEQRGVAELALHAHYAGWLDKQNERLVGATPRSAATTPELRPRLVELLRELEAEYGRRLILGEPAFDPSLLWDDLGLRDLRDGPRDLPPPLGHETMAGLVPGLSDVAAEIARQYRGSRNQDLEWTIPYDVVTRDPRARKILQEHQVARARQDEDLGRISDEVRVLATNIGLYCNFELHLRKVFWVADALSWMFGVSSLEDVEGAELRLPFGSLALVFTDRYALGLAERLLARMPNMPLRGRILRVLTAYLHNTTLPDGRRGIRVMFTCDADGDEWPALIGRDFAIEPEARVVDILRSEAPGDDADELAPLWSCVPLRHLLHLVVHAVLEVTSASGEWTARESSLPGSHNRPGGRRTAERVFELPGSIDIRVHRAIVEAKRGAVSGELIHRCLVRGYRRRANPGWKDQRKRWVKPYWRGPEDGPIVERPYRLLP